MPREGYKSVSISEELHQRLEEYAKKNRLRSIPHVIEELLDRQTVKVVESG